jgi:sulfur relay (sulfurtransferase) complex TusBCD TusD component (DsrE family)
MTRDERQEFLKILHAHAQTIAICEACASTTRDLAAEVGRGSVPSREDLIHTVNQAEQVLRDLSDVREEVERLIAACR